ncbi:hypothetical protein HGT73_05240 [Rosenbergiella australiborealis]|uniref:HEAT repeat domain-containing protein n=1 Tax=Rosenbergiella australiborealis TaxID=1544696 RepID=A0ABS5T397_9GAMM|nr:hypothetical protein [Rosenbergiella australiborealis]MBT0726791.1 hypothetical protein [Rosenbergiella australiborealis]
MNIQEVHEFKKIVAVLRSGDNQMENELIKQRIDEVIHPLKSNPLFNVLFALNETENTKRALEYLLDYDVETQEQGEDALFKLVESRVIAERAYEIYNYKQDYWGIA